MNGLRQRFDDASGGFWIETLDVDLYFGFVPNGSPPKMYITINDLGRPATDEPLAEVQLDYSSARSLAHRILRALGESFNDTAAGNGVTK